jgi:sugar/nucleoside kinase (ribokinase family)
VNEVTCLGILVADVVGKPIDTLPARGRLSLVDRMELHSGGCAANTGVGLAKLGVKTAIVGKVGSDGFGDFLISQFDQVGIDTRGICRDQTAATSATMVLVHGDGERSFIHYLGANATLTAADLDLESLFDTQILHVAGALVMPGIDGEPTAKVLADARKKGVVTALDTVWDATGAWNSKLAPCLQHTDYFLPSYEEARMIAGGIEDPDDVAKFLIDSGVKCVGLKMGEKGCLFRTFSGDTFRLPILPVNAIDALGAGDAFVAGFLAGLVRGWDLEGCARFAVAVGASCVTALGATTGVKTFDETVNFLAMFDEARG